MGWDIIVEDMYERVGAEWGTTSQPTAQQATKKNTGTKRHLCPKKSCRNTRLRQQGLSRHLSSPWEKVVSLLNTGGQVLIQPLNGMRKLRWDESGPPPSARVGKARDDSIYYLCSACEWTNKWESGLHNDRGVGGQRNSLDRNPFHQSTEIPLDGKRSPSFSLRQSWTRDLQLKGQVLWLTVYVSQGNLATRK